MFNPTHFLTSNFNLMDTNSNWKILKKRGVFIDKNYNGLSLSLNKKNLNIYDSFHAIFYLDSFNVDQIILELKNLIQFIKKNKKKYFYLYLLNNFNENPIEKKIFDNLYSKLNINLVGGDPYGGACSIDQFFLWRPFNNSINNETVVKNLHHIGASTHPGPGLSGGSGFNLAKRLGA